MDDIARLITAVHALTQALATYDQATVNVVDAVRAELTSVQNAITAVLQDIAGD